MRPHDSKILRQRGRHANLVAAMLLTVTLSPRSAAADASSLDGFAVALGPAGGVIALERGSDGWLGGSLSTVWIREAYALSAVGATVSGGWFTEASGGWLVGEAQIATNRLLPIPVGVGAGAWLELDEVRAPRGGPRISVWAFAGIVPYVGLGYDVAGEWVVDAGVRISFPVIRL